MKISETKMVGYESWEGGQWQCPKKECLGVFIKEGYKFCPGCGRKIEWDKTPEQFKNEWYGIDLRKEDDNEVKGGGESQTA